MSNHVRFLDINDYASCVELITGQKDRIEKYFEEDYRYWLSPLIGWLHPQPFERFKGSFLNQDKKLAGYFLNDKLVSFIGLNCYPKTDVGLYLYRINSSDADQISDLIFIKQTKLLFTWALSKNIKNIFSYRHVKLTCRVNDWIKQDTFFDDWSHTVENTYSANTYPENSWHQEIMEFCTYPFDIDIIRWSKM